MEELKDAILKSIAANKGQVFITRSSGGWGIGEFNIDSSDDNNIRKEEEIKTILLKLQEEGLITQTDKNISLTTKGFEYTDKLEINFESIFEEFYNKKY